MTNLLAVLPDFDIKPYTHLLPSLEKALVTANDLLTLDALDVAKRAQLPPNDVKKLANAVLDGLHQTIGIEETTEESAATHANVAASECHARADGATLAGRWSTISTLDSALDEAIAGGIPAGYLTEITGESAVGKTQFLLSLLLAVQLPAPHGPGKAALYISTEAPLQTTRLTQILQHHPRLSLLAKSEKPSLARIQSTHVHDLEAQEHIIRFQVPVAVKRNNIGLVVVDSIAANFRAEFDKGKASRGGAENLSKRGAQLIQLGALLRNLAREENIAIVVANQVADRFAPFDRVLTAPSYSQRSLSPHAGSSPLPSHDLRGLQLSQHVNSSPAGAAITLSTDDPLALDHQQRFFTGWGSNPTETNLKTPSLGLAWTDQLSARIALLKEPVYEERAYAPGEDREIIGWSRTFKIAFSAWCADSQHAFEIWEGGVRSVDRVMPAGSQRRTSTRYNKATSADSEAKRKATQQAEP